MSPWVSFWGRGWQNVITPFLFFWFPSSILSSPNLQHLLCHFCLCQALSWCLWLTLSSLLLPWLYQSSFSSLPILAVDNHLSLLSSVLPSCLLILLPFPFCPHDFEVRKSFGKRMKIQNRNLWAQIIRPPLSPGSVGQPLNSHLAQLTASEPGYTLSFYMSIFSSQLNWKTDSYFDIPGASHRATQCKC